MADLFTTYEIKGKTIPNRLVLPPIVCFNYTGTDGMPSQENIDHYKTYAEANVGLIIIEATCISPNGKIHATQMGIWDDKFIPQFKKITDHIHENNSVCLMQIQHSGVKTSPETTDQTNIFGPSEYTLADGRITREITAAEIETVIQEFANAAKRCVAAGFDGVEIHGAHGYLLAQFMSPAINRREDVYGEDMAAFTLRVIEGIKAVVPPDFIIAIRMGGNDPNFKTSVEYAKKYVAAGVDLLHISTGFVNTPPPDYIQEDDRYSMITNLGISMKKAIPDKPVIAVFGIDNPEMADTLVKEGLVDFAASARGLLSDPNWIKKYKNGEEISSCRKCKSCLWRDHGSKCPGRKRLQA